MKQKKNYRHIFFDLDHTLWDFEENSRATLIQIYKEFKMEDMGVLPMDRFIKVFEHYNDKLWERFRNGFIRRNELRWKRMWLTLIEFKIGDQKIAKEISERYLEILPTQGRLMPYAKECLEYCKSKDYKIHIITNGFETTQHQKLATSKIDTYFETMITSEKSNSLKPHKEIFEFALLTTGAELKNSIIIGDSLEADIKGGIQFGMDQVFYNPAKLKHEYQPTFEINHLKELHHIV